MNVMRCRSHSMLGKKAVSEHVPQQGQRRHHGKKRRRHHGKFHRGLPRAPRFPYRLLMPFAMASHSSWIFGLNSAMATMAITTSTPTKMAYSVVPCPSACRSFAASGFATLTCAQAKSRLACSFIAVSFLSHQNPSINSSITGPSTIRSMAGRMSVPVGIIIFTGAFATCSWRWALHVSRA